MYIEINYFFLVNIPTVCSCFVLQRCASDLSSFLDFTYG